MPYDALGNYIPGDDEPSLDQMRLALTKTQRPLDSATQTLKQVATEFNPLMAVRTLQDAPRIAYNALVAPLASTWGTMLGNVQAKGAEQAFGALGMPQEAQEAASRVREVAPTRFQAPLQSQTGEQFQEELGKLFEASKAPHMWPLTPVNPNMRPFITPNDVRVMGAEATRMGRQVRDIPMDFSNAQSGFTRIDPVTGQPTMGARLQGAAEDVGRIVEQRRAMGQSPIPGVPEVLTPETRTYAVRPAGTSLVMPQNLPKGITAGELPISPGLQGVLEDTLGFVGAKMTPDDVKGHLDYMLDHLPGVDRRAFGEFERRKAKELYPDAPTIDDAFEAMFTAIPSEDRTALTLKHFDEFRQTPEGIAAGFGNAPSSTELMQRDEAARNWLQTQFANYVKKHFGAVNDPLVKLASEGITYKSPRHIEPLDQDLEVPTVQKRREAAGLPIEGTVAPALHAAQSKLSEAEAKVNELNSQRERYRDMAMSRGLDDPAQMPEFAAITNPLNRAIAERDKLQEQVQNLELGKLYEDRADIGVLNRAPNALLSNIEYRYQQFYPSITRAQPGETLYVMRGRGALRELGYDQFVSEFYNKVLEGQIPIDKLKSLTVEKVVRQLAEPRIAKEKAEAKAALTFKTDVESVMKGTMEQYAKPENYFGNVGAVELTNAMGLDAKDLGKLLSEDTLVLDHCVGQGGTAGDASKNIWFNNSRRMYEPLYDVLGGELNRKAGRETTSYVSSILAGDMITSFRDRNTGVPVATFHLHRAGTDANGNKLYSVGYASGHRNGHVNKEYIDAIKDYLNAKSDMIDGIGNNLNENLDIFDRTKNSQSEILNGAGITRKQMNAIDWESLPRFLTKDEIKAAAASAVEAQQLAQQAPVARPTPGGVLTPEATLPQTLRDDVVSAYENAVESVETAGDAASNAGEAGRRLAHVLDHFMGRHLDEAANLVDVDRMLEDLRASSASYRSHMGAVGQLVADGMDEFITAVEGIRSAADRGHYTEPTAQVPAALPPEQRGVSLAAVQTQLDTIRQNQGVDIANIVEENINYALREIGSTNLASALADRRIEFANTLRTLANDIDSELAQIALYDLADEIHPEFEGEGFEHFAPAQAAEALMAEPEPQQPAVAPFRTLNDRTAEMTYEQLQDALTPGEIGEVTAAREDLVRNNPNPDEIRIIAQLVYDHQMSNWAEFNDTMRGMLYMELLSIANMLDHRQAEGGPVRGYADGGKVEYPPFYSASNQAITRAQEMYPNAQGQDDEVDAARHMLASGYMTQSFGPTIAKGLGYAHELKEAPIRTAGSWLGLSKPRYDYNMDVRNNALGIELAQKAKDRADFERLVQESIAKGSAQLMTPEQAKAGRGMLKYANGGTVSQTPSLDNMQFELLMRSK